VIPGPEFRETEQERASGFVDLLRPALQGFAYVALFVAAFVIFNTFSVVVTQRFRELALIRAVGGTPGQVRRSLLAEGLAIGAVASAVGIVAGALLALLVQAVLAGFGVELPGAGVAVTPSQVLLCLGVGTVVTVLSVAVPAFRAGRTRPVEAMRDSEVDVSGTSRARAVIGGSALALAAALLLAARLVGPRIYFLLPGALLLFVGLVVGGPLLARLYALALGPVLRRFGLTGRLALDNSVRNPRRTATTANALVVGLFLVTLVTVSGDALKTWIVDQLNQLSSSDYIVAGTGGPVDPELVRRIDATEGVAESAPVRTTTALDSADRIVILSGADVDRLRRTTGLEVVSGSLDEVASSAGVAVVDLGQLGGGGGAGSAGPGEDREIAQIGGRLGQQVQLVGPDGTVLSVPVVATLEPKIDTLFLGTLVSEEALEAIAGTRPVTQVFVRAESGALDAVGVRLDRLAERYAGIEVQPGNFIGAAVAQVFDFLIGAVNALLGMSVAIALIGVVNTLTLSILERRRELGMVRALGMTRGQVAATIRIEGVVIGSLGTVVGMSAGLLLGWVLIGGIGDGEVALSVNWARIGLIALAGVAVGVVASLLPARRALRIDVLEATRAT
jgi:putative ABC transport system permease protein